MFNLEVGEPDFETPANILETGIRALKAGDTRYGPAPGILELREAIAHDVSVRPGVEVKPLPGGDPELVIAGTKRVWSNAWAKLKLS